MTLASQVFGSMFCNNVHISDHTIRTGINDAGAGSPTFLRTLRCNWKFPWKCPRNNIHEIPNQSREPTLVPQESILKNSHFARREPNFRSRWLISLPYLCLSVWDPIIFQEKWKSGEMRWWTVIENQSDWLSYRERDVDVKEKWDQIVWKLTKSGFLMKIRIRVFGGRKESHHSLLDIYRYKIFNLFVQKADSNICDSGIKTCSHLHAVLPLVTKFYRKCFTGFDEDQCTSEAVTVNQITRL
jgi:hypothetical protein